MNISENKYSSKKYIVTTGIVTIIILICIGYISYTVDPFLQFRVNADKHYFLNPRLVNGGLAKNADYNTVALGSSMVQNYNISILRAHDASCNPVKLSTGGMNYMEMEYLYSFIKKDQVSSFIINLDIPQFNLPFEEIRYPKYLYDDGILNKLEYLYGYETCIRFTPIDIGLSIYLKDKTDISPEYRMKTNIDEIGNNSLDNIYNGEYVKQLYLNGTGVSFQVQEGMTERMQSRLDSLLSRLEVSKYKSATYTFVLPPYSALYWYHTKKAGYYSQFIDFIHYLEKSIQKYDNARIMFFFDSDEITDLNYYSDISHFSPALSDKILNNIHNEEYLLSSDNINYKIQRLDSLVNSYIEENKDWLPK